MSWTAILVLSGGAYLFKVVGLVTGDRLSVGLAPAAGLLPAALFAAILAIGSIDSMGANASQWPMAGRVR